MFPSASNRCVAPVMRRSRIAKTELRRNRIPHIWRAPGFASSRTCPTFFRKCSARPPLVDLWVDTDVNRRGEGASFDEASPPFRRPWGRVFQFQFSQMKNRSEYCACSKAQESTLRSGITSGREDAGLRAERGRRSGKFT